MGERSTTEDGENKHLDSAHNIVSDTCMFELVGRVADVVATAFQLPRDNTAAGAQQGGRGGDGEDVRVSIGPPAEPVNVPAATMSPVLLARALWTLALLTLIVDVGTMLYRPPRGAFFGHHRLAYYLALDGVFVAGAAEAWVAFWISRSPDVYRRRFSLGRVVLCASIGPFVIVVAIGSFAFIDD
ncbi:hypothetical protein ACQJBY_040568 [Aegilops geniculata]